MLFLFLLETPWVQLDILGPGQKNVGAPFFLKKDLRGPFSPFDLFSTAFERVHAGPETDCPSCPLP